MFEGGFRSGAGAIWREVKQTKHLPVALLITAYVGWFVHLSLALYWGYGDPPFDLSVWDQGLWLLSHFHAPFVTIMGRDLFGDHSTIILYLVAPFYRLFPEPQGLLVLQTLLLAAPAVPIYILAQKWMKHTVVATLLAATYLLNPALQMGNLEQFHPESFLVLFITLAIYAAIEYKPVMFALMVALALLVKEDTVLLLAPLGVWVGFRRSWKWGARTIVASIVWALIANLVIIRSILGTAGYYAVYIPFGGISKSVATLARSPGKVLALLRGDGRPFYVWQMGVSAGWGFLLSPEIALIGLLVLLENVFSTLVYMHQINYHYSMVLVPVLVLGTAFAIAKQKTVRRRNVATVVVVACAFWSCLLWGLAPFSDNTIHPYWSSSSPMGQASAALERAIPPDAVVSAWYPMVPFLDHRTQIYVWPVPFYTLNWGLGTNGLRLPQARRVQYLLLPTPLSSVPNADVFTKIANSYTLVRSQSGLSLYKRRAE